MIKENTIQEKQRGTDANRDPITGTPGGHPVGTGVGAAGGAAAGAAIGAVAGPVGAAVGLVAGAVAGGLAGKGVAEKMDPTVEDAYRTTNYSKQKYVVLDPTFDPNASIRRNVGELMSQRMTKNATQGNLFSSLLETKAFVGGLPSRLNNIMDAITNHELEVKVKAVDAKLAMEGFQKVANRVATGIEEKIPHGEKHAPKKTKRHDPSNVIDLVSILQQSIADAQNKPAGGKAKSHQKAAQAGGVNTPL